MFKKIDPLPAGGESPPPPTWSKMEKGGTR